MTRSLAHHLGLRLLALVMSWVILAPKVIYAYDLTKNNNVRPFYRKTSRFAETNAFIDILYFGSIDLQLAVYVFRLRHLTAHRVRARTKNDPVIGDRMMLEEGRP
jgi:hypothetical protein